MTRTQSRKTKNGLYNAFDTPEASVGTVSMNIKGSKGKLVMVIEGEDDEDFLEKVIDKKTVQLLPSDGRDHYPHVLNELKHKSDRFVIFQDGDFDHLKGTGTVAPNHFLTDEHDMEMLILSRVSIKELLKKFSKKEAYMNENWFAVFFHKLMKDMRSFSLLKYYNDKKGCYIAFKYKKFELQCICGRWNAGIDGMVQYIMDRQQGEVDNFKLEEFKAFCESNPDLDCLQLTNGHEVLALMLDEMRAIKIRRNNPKKKDIPKELVTMFNFEVWRKTNMYKAFSEWLLTNKWKVHKIDDKLQIAKR